MITAAHSDARAPTADVVLAIYRAIKTAQLHAIDNQAVRRQLEATAEAIHVHHLRTGAHVMLLFARGAVFLGGIPLRAPRQVYEAARELESMVERCGGAELSLAGDISVDELRAFVVAVTSCLRDPGTSFAQHRVPKARIRAVRADALLRGIDVESLDEEQRVVRTYASAVVVLRRFYEQLDAGDAILPRRLKRLAQSLVDLSAGTTPAFLGVTGVRNAGHDAAGRAVNGAILSVAMARQLTSDRAVLTLIAMAAMTCDVGRPRAVRSMALETGGTLPIAVLPDAVERALPGGTVATLIAGGGAEEAAMARAVVVYETLWLARGGKVGPPYQGSRAPTLHARIVAMARAYNDLLTPLPGETPRTSAEALAELDAEAERRARAGDTADRTVLRLLLAVLGVLPAGTLVELLGGQIAVVLASSDDGAPMRAQLVVDGSGGVVVDGAVFSLDGDPARSVRRVVGSDPSFSARAPAPSVPAITPLPSSIQRPSDLPTSGVHVRAGAPSSRPPRTPPPPAPSTGDRTIAAPSVFDDASTDDDLELRLPPRTSMPPYIHATPARPAPSAEGTMDRAPLPHLLVHLLSRELTGTLVLTTPHGDEHVATFDSGVPQRLRTTISVSPLGATLVRLGDLDEHAVDGAVLRASAEGALLGELLVAEGLVARDALERALRDQLGARVAALVELPRATRYAFYVDHDLLAGTPGEATPVDPLALVMATVRDWTDDDRMESVLAGLRERPIGLHTHAEVGRFALSPPEEEIIESMRAGWLPYGDLLGAYDDREAIVRRVVYALTITKHIDFGQAGSWPVGASPAAPTAAAEAPPPAPFVPVRPRARLIAPPPGPAPAKVEAPPAWVSPPAPDSSPPSVSSLGPWASPETGDRLSSPPVQLPSRPRIEPSSVLTSPPRGKSPKPAPVQPATPPAELEARRARLREGLSRLDGDLYAALGVGRDASHVDIQTAYFEAARLFHPDKVPEALEDLRDDAERVFVRVAEAHRTLSDSTRRAAYDRKLDGTDEGAVVARVLDGVGAFERAEVMLKRGDVAAAEKQAALAVATDPESADSLALLGWLRGMTTDRLKLRGAIELLDQALQRNPSSDRALFYRGSLLKRAGRGADALRDFRNAADINPQNLDAVREVRLHALRETTDARSKGLFTRLFKK